MKIELTSGGPTWDTQKTAENQLVTAQRFLADVQSMPFNEALSTREDCGKLTYPDESGIYGNLYRWPVRVWETDTARITLATAFQAEPTAANCMAEQTNSIHVTAR